MNVNQKPPFTLPDLPYGYAELEPVIDGKTMELHYTKHHKGYVDKLNDALKNSGQKQEHSLVDLMRSISSFDTAVRNNGGGHFNHTFFWRILSPDGTKEPVGDLKNAINDQYGSFDRFREEFKKAATSRFGSGWAWLVVDADGMLNIGSTPNQDNPLMDIASFKGIPILGLDVWEHAYYLSYQNRRPEYVDAFWDVVNWMEVEAQYQDSLKEVGSTA